MIIGVPKEIKDNEFRVGLTPAGAAVLIQEGHEVYVQKNAGFGSGLSDELYIQAGAKILDHAAQIFETAEMIIKVKEPQSVEVSMMKEGQILFTYLHLAPAPELTKQLLDKKISGIAYETIQLDDGSLPLLRPMSEVAGRLAVQIGSYYLQKDRGGSGVLLGGVPGVKPGRVTIVGAGIVGINSLKMAVGLGAQVSIFDINPVRLAYLDDLYGGRVTTIVANAEAIAEEVALSDLLIGAVLIMGAKAPRLVTRAMLSRMRPNSVAVDVSVDQGGCFESTKPTTHSHPTYFDSGVLHYCVSNIPGAVSRTSTFALTNVTLPYARKLANFGLRKALKEDPALAKGLNVHAGEITQKAVAEAFEAYR
ncbi:MAG: ald [Bacteriovoracaceae bacterium]|nr:ald [Bacteriovoracaceae bacterium]